MSRELELLEEAVKLLKEKESRDVVECSKGTADKVELSTLAPGEVFKIGEHDFIVLKQSNEQTMVISKGFMAEDVVFDENVRDYNKSSLKELIESEIQPLIEKEVGAGNIIEHEVDLTSVDMQNEFGSCKCKVRSITFDEAREFNDLLVNEDLNDWWWTLTPWSTEKRGWQYSIAVVSSSGNICRCYCNYNLGVRLFCIFSSSIFESEE